MFASEDEYTKGLFEMFQVDNKNKVGQCVINPSEHEIKSIQQFKETPISAVSHCVLKYEIFMYMSGWDFIVYSCMYDQLLGAGA